MTTTRRAVLLAATAALAGCHGVPVIEVADVRFAPPEVGLPGRAAQVRRAAAGLGWATEEIAPGRIRATRDAEGRRAVVEVAFDRRGFSIRHEASGRTEPAYNVEVARLRDAIVAQSGV